MSKHAHSVDNQILRRMRALGKTHAFTPSDFLDLGPRAAVDKALSRNARLGIIRRVGHGLYDVPRDHPLMGRLSPNADAVVKAIAKRANATVLPSGANSANALGLSDQVPMRPVYVTDGRRRKLQMGKASILMQHAAPQTVRTKHPASAAVIQALKWIGRKHVDNDTLVRLRRNLKPAERAALVQDAPRAPGWIADIFHQLAKDSPP
jgi:hypothetical protein